MKLKLKCDPAPRPSTAMTVKWFSNWIGESRWKKVLEYVKLKYGTKKVFLGYHTKGGGAELYVMLPKEWKHIGNFATIEAKAKRKRR